MTSLLLSAPGIALALFLLYSNVLVTASQEGMVPAALAAVIPLLLGIAVVRQLVIYRRRIIVDRTFFGMLAFLVVLLVSAFWARGFGAAVERILVFTSEGLLIYFLVRNAVRTSGQLKAAVAAVVTAGGLLAALSAVQVVTGNYEQEFLGLAQRAADPWDEVRAGVGTPEIVALQDRARGPVDEPNRFAQILLVVAPLALVLGLNATRKGQLVTGLGLAFLLLAGVLLTYSRGAMVTIAVLTVLAVAMRLISARTVAIGAVVATLAIPFVMPNFVTRVQSMAGVAGLFGTAQVEADGPTRGRTTEMLAALAAWVDHPVLGVGPGQYLPHYSVQYQNLPELSFRELPTPRRAHSLYLELMAETGTLGLLVFMAIPFLLLRDLEGLRRTFSTRRPDLARWAAGFSLAVLAYLGTGVFLHLAFERYYWLVIALTACAVGVLRASTLDIDPLPENRQHPTPQPRGSSPNEVEPANAQSPRVPQNRGA